MSEGLDRRWRRGPKEIGLHRDRTPARPKHWEEQEEIGARAHNARRTVGSGSTWKPDQKLDSVGDIWRMSNKSTAGGRKAAKSIRFERGWLEEAKRAARSTNHQPVVMFGFDPDEHDQREDWVAMPAAQFEIINRLLKAVAEGEDAEARALLSVLKRKT